MFFPLTCLGGGILSEVTCGSDGCSTQGEENRACMPIDISHEDSAFGSMRCLMFVRTQEVPQLDCQLGKLPLWVFPFKFVIAEHSQKIDSGLPMLLELCYKK